MKKLELKDWMNLFWPTIVGLLLQAWAVQSGSLLIRVTGLVISILPFWYVFNYYKKLRKQNIGSTGFWRILKIIFIPCGVIWIISILVSLF